MFPTLTPSFAILSARELDAIIATRARPKCIVSDNGTELTSMVILKWSQDRGLTWHYIAPGKPRKTGSMKASMASCGTMLERNTVQFSTARQDGPHHLFLQALRQHLMVQHLFATAGNQYVIYSSDGSLPILWWQEPFASHPWVACDSKMKIFEVRKFNLR